MGCHHRCKYAKNHKCIYASSSSSENNLNDDEEPAVMRVHEGTWLGVDAGFLDKPRYTNRTYNIAIGRNHDGIDSGSLCVIKWPKDDHVCDVDDHFLMSWKTTHRAAEIIKAFMKSVGTNGWTIMLNEPQVVRCTGNGCRRSSQRVMVEDFIEGFKHFNTRSGWTRPNDRTYNKVLQALSHFSYTSSGGNLLLCDLRGGVDSETKTVTLTEPIILSKEGGVFGCLDTGKEGMHKFFQSHKCNTYCSHFIPKERKNVLFKKY